MSRRMYGFLVLLALASEAQAQALPPQTDAEVTVLEGRPSVATGTYRLAQAGGIWTGTSGGTTMTIAPLGNTLYLELKANGRIWHGNTILTIDAGTYTFRLGGLDGSGEVRVRVRR